MEWDNCVLEDVSIAETIYNKYNNIIELKYKKGDDEKEEEVWNYMGTEIQIKDLLKLLKVIISNDITERMNYWENKRDIENFEKIYRMKTLNSIQNIIMNNIKLNRIFKELKVYYNS